MNELKVDTATALAELRETKPDRVTIVLLSGDMDRAMAAFIIATGAAAMGMPVTMFLRSRFFTRVVSLATVCGPYFLVAIFLPAIALAGPLRVRALV